MEYHNRLSEIQKSKLGDKYIAEGTTITDKKTGIVSDIVSVEQGGFKLLPQSGLDNAPRQEFFVPFEEIVDKHDRNLIDVSGYDFTEPDHKMLILVIKDIMGCAIIGEKSSEISRKEDAIKELEGKVELDSVVDVPIEEELAKGGIVGEIKASPSGIIKEVRDNEGKLLKEVHVGDTLYKRNNQFGGTYRNSGNDLLYRYDADRIHMAYGGIVGVQEKPNFYAVDIASPKKVQTCRVPAWATNVAESVKEGAKVTTCKAHGKWYVSSILVPKDGITSNEAKHIGAEIRDKIERRKMEAGGPVFETGAKDYVVDGLVLFADNTRSLAEMRNFYFKSFADRIKSGQSLTKQSLKAKLIPFWIKTQQQYRREIENLETLTDDQQEDFIQLYVDYFPIWAKENYADFDKIKSSLSEIYGRKFASGGTIEQDSDKVAAAEYWDGLDIRLKLHFLMDHADYVYGKPASKLDKKTLAEYKKLSRWTWNRLPKEVQMAVEEHVIMGIYEDGGKLNGYTSKDESGSNELIGDDVKSTADAILVMIECTEDEEEKEALRKKLKDYDYQAN